MKKITLFMLTVVSAMFVLTGCSEKNKEPFVQKSFEAETVKVKEVNIDVWDRQIEVSLSEDDKIHIDYFDNSKEYYDISISDDQVLTMTAESDKEWKDYIGSKSDADARKIVLQIPDSLLSKLTLTTKNEDIVLSALTVQTDISLSANGGNIIFDQVNVGNALNLTAKNGNISGTIIGGYDDFAINCEIKKGESNLPSEKSGGAKTLNVSNNNGNIDIEFVQD